MVTHPIFEIVGSPGEYYFVERGTNSYWAGLFSSEDEATQVCDALNKMGHDLVPREGLNDEWFATDGDLWAFEGIFDTKKEARAVLEILNPGEFHVIS